MHRQRKLQIFDFCNIGSDLNRIKSENSRKDYPNADTHVLDEHCVGSCAAENVEAFILEWE